MVSQLLLQNVVNARIVVVNVGKQTLMDKKPQLLELDKENSAWPEDVSSEEHE